jgi:hypothetical protein
MPSQVSFLEPITHVTTWLALLALGMLLGGAAWIWIYAFSTPGSHWSYVGIGMLTALAALLTGFLAGFLLGVPKIGSSGQVHLKTRMFSPSTNLAEISDWLTKLLLGAGLVSLTHLGGPIGRLIDNVAGGLHGTTSDLATIQAAKVSSSAVACRWGPVALPPVVHGAIHTCRKFRMRLALPVADHVRK